MSFPRGPFDLPARVPAVRSSSNAPSAPVAAGSADQGADMEALDRLLGSAELAEWARPLLRAWASSHGTEAARGICSALLTPEGAPHVPAYLRAGAPEPRWLARFLTDPAIDFAVQREWLARGFLRDDPPWLTHLVEREQAQIARSFLLTGNIADYAYDPHAGYRPGLDALVDRLRRVKECVLIFGLSQGLRLATADEGVRDRLPKQLRDWVDRGFFDLRQPALAGQICTLFDTLRRWLLEETDFPGGVAIIFENVHLLISANGADLERNFLIDSLLSWSTTPRLFHKPHCLVLMAEALEDVSNDLRARGAKMEQIQIERPSHPDVRLKFLLPLLQPQAQMVETRVARLREGLELEGYPGDWIQQMRHLAHDTAGLTLMGIEDIIQDASGVHGSRIHSRDVMAAKRERLQQESEGLLEIIPPRRTLKDLGGYPALKQRLAEVIQALLHAADPLVKSTIPMGMLFLGPPGTGKTVAAEAIAGESGISMAKLGDFRGMYVGQSERNLSRLLALIASLHPVIVFMDELDQSEGSRGEGGDSGVSKRVFSRLLQFMSDTTHRGEILWVGASNRPDLIDAAMKRAGRFDLTLPFLLPDQESRADIFRLVLTARLHQAGADQVENALAEEDYLVLAEATAGFSGAEIEAILGEVLRRAAGKRSLGQAVRIDRAAVQEVLSVYVPPQVRDQYARMEDLALREVSFLDLLPKELKGRRLELSSGAAPEPLG